MVANGTNGSSHINGTHEVEGGLTEPELDERFYDAEQLKLMEERLILLDRNDNPIGDASKKTCTACI